MLNEKTNEDWLPGLITQLKRRIFRDMENSLPCEVTKINSDRTFVSVRPLITMIDSDGNRLSRNTIQSIPVSTSGAGGMLISFPINIGDLGWIESNDRDISLFLQSHSENQPATDRMHSFSDAKFVPDIMHNFTISGGDSDALVIQNRDGTVKIAIDSQIRISNGSTELTITDSSIQWNAPDGFTINGAQITSSGDFITASGISVDGHQHDQGADSDGNTQQTTSSPI